MMRVLLLPFRLMRRFRRREDGNATVEFAILFPVFITIFLSGFELAYMMLRQVWLDRSLDVAVRDLRLGTHDVVSADVIKAQICSGMGGFVTDCSTNLLLELQSIDRASWVTPDPGAKCVDRAEYVQPLTTFQPGVENEMMLIRACILMDPLFPGTALALSLEKNSGDGVAIVATSGFVNEPDPAES